jgi:hypothetical protein
MSKTEVTTTETLLRARYGGVVAIPLDVLVRDFFNHLSEEKFLRKVLSGEIALPVMRMEASQKSVKAVPVSDFAVYLDQKIEAARKECRQLSGAAS